jgi:predicted Zn-dependent protease with MMP-like domain
MPTSHFPKLQVPVYVYLYGVDRYTVSNTEKLCPIVERCVAKFVGHKFGVKSK